MLTVFDIGGRYGIHPNWIKLFKKNLVNYYAFEVDEEEVDRLIKKYKAFENYTAHNIGFSDIPGTLTMNILEHKGQSSFLVPNLDSNWFGVHRNQDSKINERVEYTLTTLHQYTSQTSIFPDFLKIDTEGMDLKVLRGSIEFNEPVSGNMLEKVLAISCEVYFEEVFEDTPLFGEIHSFLLDHGFKLANLAYEGKGIPTSYFCPNPNYFGIISGGEATYIKPFEGLSTLSKQKLALFCFNNRIEDYALLILKDLIAIDDDSFRENKLWLELKREFALSTKKLMYQPGNSFQKAKIDFELIFKSIFPEMHHFFEDDEFNPA